MAQTAVVSLEALRARIRELEGTPVHVQQVATGVQAFDELVGGLPRPGLVELHGPPGTGRTRLALAVAARWTAERALVAWVDADHTLYPPAAADLEVVLRRLLIVRPPHDRVPWAVEQLLRSGCFPLVVASGLGRVGKAGHGWAHAAEAGGCTGLILGERPFRQVPAGVRLAVGSGEVTVVRNRGGRTGRSASLPRVSEWVDPWR